MAEVRTNRQRIHTALSTFDPTPTGKRSADILTRVDLVSQRLENLSIVLPVKMEVLDRIKALDIWFNAANTKIMNSETLKITRLSIVQSELSRVKRESEAKRVEIDALSNVLEQNRSRLTTIDIVSVEAQLKQHSDRLREVLDLVKLREQLLRQSADLLYELQSIDHTVEEIRERLGAPSGLSVMDLSLIRSELQHYAQEVRVNLEDRIGENDRMIDECHVAIMRETGPGEFTFRAYADALLAKIAELLTTCSRKESALLNAAEAAELVSALERSIDEFCREWQEIVGTQQTNNWEQMVQLQQKLGVFILYYCFSYL